MPQVLCRHHITTCTQPTPMGYLRAGIQCLSNQSLMALMRGRPSTCLHGRMRSIACEANMWHAPGHLRHLHVCAASKQPDPQLINTGMLPLQVTGQVMSASSNMVRVELDIADGPSSAQSSSSSGRPLRQLPKTQLLCSLRTLLKKLNQKILVGDVVRVGSIDWSQGKGQVEEVMPRNSELTDPAVANVDFALLVFALHNPPFEEMQVSRFLVAMEASGIPFQLVLNKADLVTAAEVEQRVQQVRSWGYEPLVVSCEGDGRGIDEVLSILAGKTSVIAGPSGAGKSSLINAIRMGRHRADQAADSSDSTSSRQVEAYGAPPLRVPTSVLSPEEAQASTSSSKTGSSSALVASRGGLLAADQDETYLAVGDLSRIGRGRHTTTAVTLIRLPKGGRLADTPGFSQPSLEHVSSTDLSGYFPEFQKAISEAGGCQFNNCMHMLEPGCVVNNHQPAFARYLHYAKFLLEIKEHEGTDVKSLQANKKAREGQSKVKTERGGRLRAEAKLDASKHRRTSRTSAKQRVRDMWDE